MNNKRGKLMKSFFKNIVNKNEGFALSFGRAFFVIVVSGSFLAIIGLLLYTLLAPLNSDTKRVEQPNFEKTFNAPALNPVDRLAREERIREARKSFEAALTDVMTQVDQTSKNLFKEYREITSRYDELAEKPENKINMRELAAISERMSDELSQSCSKADIAFAQQFGNIKRDISQIAEKYNVAREEISTNHDQRIAKYIRNNEHCLQQSENVKKIAANLSVAYSGNWGLPVDNYRASYLFGEKEKSSLPLAVSNLLWLVEDDINYEQNMINFTNSLVSFTKSLSVYYSNVADELEKSNRMTAKNSELLAMDITQQIQNYTDNAIQEFERFKYEESLISETTYSQRLIIHAQTLSPAILVILPFLFGSIFILLFFAYERHFRRINDKNNLN